MGAVARRELQILVDKETQPAVNVASEDRIFGQVERRELPDVLRFWKNTECLIRGKVRNPKYGWYREELAEKLGVPVVERSTGGGVVYNDLGNLNWSFYTEGSGAFVAPETMFQRAAVFVVDALRLGGFDARFSAPNRIDVSGKKVSGMAARSSRSAQLVHGTLLIAADLGRLNSLCIAPPGCPPVSNLREWLVVDEAVLEQAITERMSQTDYDVLLVNKL